jgi:hypothetical protein
VRAAALVLLSGCTALFGIKEVGPPPPDSGQRTVHCDYLWHIVDSAGTVEMIAAPPGQLSVRFGGQDIAIGGDGSFSFDATPGPWELELMVDGERELITRDTDTCHLVETFFHRMGGKVPTMSTPVTVNTSPPPPATGFVRVTSTGIRTWLSPVGTAATYTVDWHGATDLSGAPAALLSGAAGDRMYVVHYATPSGYNVVDQAGEAASTLTLVDGTGNPPVPITLGATPPRCTRVQTHNASLASMLVAAAPRATDATAAYWGIQSIAAPAEGHAEGNAVAFDTVSTPVDDDIQLTYGNPYQGETDVLVTGVSASHTLASGTATQLKLASAINTYTLPQPDTTGSCNSTTTAALPPSALPTTTTVAGQQLTTDGQSVTIDRSAPVPIAVGLTAGSYDQVVVALDEVVVQNGATALTSVAVYAPLDATAGVDPASLLVGHQYVVVMVVYTGIPGSRAADFRVHSYPASQAAVASFSFRVAN